MVKLLNVAALPSAYVVPLTFVARICQTYVVLAVSPVTEATVLEPALIHAPHEPFCVEVMQYS